MKPMKKRIIRMIILILFSITACQQESRSSQADSSDKQRPTVFVSILPQSYFVERIAGDTVDVSVMVPPGASPASYEPKAEQLAELSRASLYFSIGVPFESAWLDRIAAANPNMNIIDTAEGIERGQGGASYDPHIWLSPELVRIQAETIKRALEQQFPENRSLFQQGYDQFMQEISNLQQEIQKSLQNIPNRSFIVFHPSWGYFAREFDLQQIPIEIEGQEPSAQELGELIRYAKEQQISVVFAQPEFSTRSAQIIANEIGGSVIQISPLSQNWLENLNTVARTLSQTLRNQP